MGKMMQCKYQNPCNNDKRKRTKLYDIGGKVQKCKDNILRLKIECNEGDILLINTRLWWHQTEIPSTESQQQKPNLRPIQ